MANGLIVSMTIRVCSLFLYAFQSLIDENAETGHNKYSAGWVGWGESQPKKYRLGYEKMGGSTCFLLASQNQILQWQQ